MSDFQALRTQKNDDGSFTTGVATRSLDELPAGEVLIRVQFSSLNFKDALSASGNPGVTREFPHTPGIDAAGVVESSEDERFSSGDEVIVTGYDLGMNTDGGLAEYIRVPADWVVPLPAGLNTRQSMIIGTAGLTAALCMAKLQQMDIVAGARTIVSGASGGVGSFAIALLAHLGYLPVASTGSTDAAAYLQKLGADQIQDRALLGDSNPRPMLKCEWDAGIDTVGGDTLANIIKGLHYGGSVAAVGLVGGTEIPTSVLPFILRNVNLLGVDSVEISHDRRQQIWGKLAGEWKLPDLESLATDATLEDVPALLQDFLQGAVQGRVVVALP